MTPVSRRLCDFHSLLNCISYEYGITHGILINGSRNTAVHTCAWHYPLYIAEHFWRFLTTGSLYECGHWPLVCKGDSNESLCGMFGVLTVLLWVTRTYSTRNTVARNRWFKSADGTVCYYIEEKNHWFTVYSSIRAWFVFSFTCLCVAKCIWCVSAEFQHC
jgi:hypothetical protein